MQAKHNSNKDRLWLDLTRLSLGPVNGLARDGGHQQRGSSENLDNVLLWAAASMSCSYDENVVKSDCVIRDTNRLGGCMETVTVSPKFQVVIPRAVRDSLGIRPGQKVQVIPYGNRIELIPLRPIEETRGFLRGIDTTVEREQDRV